MAGNQHLSDDSETEYGLEVMREYVANLPNQDTAERFARQSAGWTSAPSPAALANGSDLLSMWIAYAKRGGGYCIEFDGRALLGSSLPPFLKLPFKMSYGKRLAPAVGEMLKYACHFARAGEIEATVSASWIGKLALMFKHPAFAHERRFVIPNPPVSALKFRAGDAEIKPTWSCSLRPRMARDGYHSAESSSARMLRNGATALA